MEFKHKGITYHVDDEIECKQGLDPNYRTLTAPFSAMGETMEVGFNWNGASSPRTPFARFIAPKFYCNLKASCLHDQLCFKAGADQEKRAEADAKYMLMLKYVEKVSWWRYSVGYAGVRIGAAFGVGTKGVEHKPAV